MPNAAPCISVEDAIRNAVRTTRLGVDGVHIEPTKGVMQMLQWHRNGAWLADRREQKFDPGIRKTFSE
jgi:hypothetical protein